MRAGGSPDDTWEDGGSPPSNGEDRASIDAAAAWLTRSTIGRLDIHMRATDPSQAEREMAFAAMAAELVQATAHVRELLSVAQRLKAEATVLRRAVTRQRASKADTPTSGATAEHRVDG